MVTISWDHPDDNAEFRIRCTNEQISISTTTNGTNEAIIKLSLDTHYHCCVTAVTPNGESEGVCEDITTG